MRPKDPDLDIDWLRSRLAYDPKTGVFTWIRRWSRASPDRLVAGHIDPETGYRWIGVKRRLVTAGRLAWFHVHGRWPDGFIDHIDGDIRNNSIANLREATRHQNNRNARTRKDNTSGARGVYVDRTNAARPYFIKVGSFRLPGNFASKAEAIKVRRALAKTEFREFYTERGEERE